MCYRHIQLNDEQMIKQHIYKSIGIYVLYTIVGLNVRQNITPTGIIACAVVWSDFKSEHGGKTILRPSLTTSKRAQVQ